MHSSRGDSTPPETTPVRDDDSAIGDGDSEEFPEAAGAWRRAHTRSTVHAVGVAMLGVYALATIAAIIAGVVLGLRWLAAAPG